MQGWRLTAAYNWSESLLVFVEGGRASLAPGHRRIRLRSHIVALDAAIDLPKRWSISASVATPAWSEAERLDSAGDRLRAAWGISGAIRVSREWLGPNRAGLFLSTTLALGVVATGYDRGFDRALAAQADSRGGEADTMLATDISLNLVLGATVARVFSPYIAVRGFGGPVLWEGLGGANVGSDPRHFAVALGSVFDIAGRVIVGIEGAPLGAKHLSGMVGVRF